MPSIVHRCKITEAFYILFNLRSANNTFRIDITSLHDTMPYGIYFIKTFDSTKRWIEQTIKHKANAFLMGWQVGHNGFLLTIGQFHLDKGIIYANSLDTSLCQHRLVVHVVELILNRTAPTI